MTLDERSKKAATEVAGRRGRRISEAEIMEWADAFKVVARDFADTCLDNRGQGDDVHCGDHDGALGWCKECREAVIEAAERDV